MNANDLLDHALGQTDDLERFERELATDPAATLQFDRLSRSIQHLLDDGEAFEPPPGLADRTLRFVNESSRRQRTILDFTPSRVRFRWSDAAVAAGIFLAGVLTLLPAVQRSRDKLDQASCTYNLQRLGQALWLYGSHHQHFPTAAEVNGKAPVASFLAMLNDEHKLSVADLDSIECPSVVKAHNHQPLPDFDTLTRLHADDPERVKHILCTNYAYNPGYRSGPSNEIIPIAADLTSRIPLLGDAPQHRDYQVILAGNSPNHGGRGQNVLYTDLHVGWHNTRRLSPTDPDMYLNNDYKLAPGLSAHDSILMPSLAPSVGW